MVSGDSRGLPIPILLDILQLTMQTGSRVIGDYDEATGVPTEAMINPEDFEVDGGRHYLIEDLVLGPPGEP